MAADSDEDDELFKFASYKPTVEQERIYHDSLLRDIDNAEDELLHKRKYPIPTGLAAQLVSGRTEGRKRKRNDDDDDLFINEDDKLKVQSDIDDKKQAVHDDGSTTDSDSDLSLLDDKSYSYGYCRDTSPKDYRAMVIMDTIDDTLCALKQRGGSRDWELIGDDPLGTGDDLLDAGDSIVPLNLGQTNVRVRCQGTVHTFQLMKDDCLSAVAGKLSDIYNGKDILLQFRAKDVKQSDTIGSLGLSTVDILDAFPMDKVNSVNVCTTNTTKNRITSNELSIKIRSSKQTLVCSIKEDEPFEKIMKKFADKINSKLTKIKFTFDGAVITKKSSPSDHEMEDGDIIDATVK